MDGVTLKNLQILGFAKGISMDYAPRAVLAYISGDNVTGIELGVAWDVVRIHDIHFWPFLSNGTGQPVSSAYHRSGSALYLRDRNDILQVTNFFSYGYYRGILVAQPSWRRDIRKLSCRQYDDVLGLHWVPNRWARRSYGFNKLLGLFKQPRLLRGHECQ